MTQKIVRSETSELTSRIFGSFDCNVKMIEEAFGVTVQNRSAENGDAILISGEGGCRAGVTIGIKSERTASPCDKACSVCAAHNADGIPEIAV